MSIKNYDFKTGLPQEFEILDLAAVYREFKDTLTISHRTDFYHIIWFKNGNLTHYVDFNPIEIKPNTLLFLNKNTVHRFDHDSTFAAEEILFTDSFFCRSEMELKFLRSTIMFNDWFAISQIQLDEKATIFTQIMDQMKDELENEYDNSQSDILRNLLYNFLLHAERKLREQSAPEIKKGAYQDYVIHFKDLLEQNYKSHKQVSYYAATLLISEKRLNQATTKLLGKTIKKLINDRLMLEAKRILVHTNLSIKEICYTLGFDEPTNFIKFFKKHASITPTDFRINFCLA